MSYDNFEFREAFEQEEKLNFDEIFNCPHCKYPIFRVLVCNDFLLVD